jgi:hypothetical protein
MRRSTSPDNHADCLSQYDLLFPGTYCWRTRLLSSLAFNFLIGGRLNPDSSVEEEKFKERHGGLRT